MALRLWRAGVVIAVAWAIRHGAQRPTVVPGLTLAEAHIFFPTAASVEPDASRGGVDVLDADRKTLGALLSTSPETDDIVGYSGPNDMLVALDSDGAVLDWRLRRSGDTPEHVSKVKNDAAFARSFIGWKPGRPLPVAAVSGATLTSAAIAEAIQRRLGSEVGSLRFPEGLRLDDARAFFPQAASLENGTVKDPAGTVLGSVVRTAPVSDTIVGYQGPTESLVGLDPDGQTVRGVRIRKSFDSPDYVDQVRDDRHFLKSFAGRKVSEIAAMDYEKEGIEGVSGATRTSYAIAEGLRRRFNQPPAATPPGPAEKPSRLAFNLTLAVFAAGGVAMAFTAARGRRWVRWLWQAAVVAGVGIASGGLLSQALVIGWLRHSPEWREVWGLLVLAGLAVLLPWADGKNVYCHQLCPHGHLQTWIGRPWQRRRNRRTADGPKTPHRLRSMVRRLASGVPGLLLAAVAMLAVLDRDRSFAPWEPFAAWSAPMWLSASFGLAAIGMIAAIFWPQAYCHYGCPTGALLRFVRHRGSADRWGWRDTAAALLLLGVLAAVWLADRKSATVAAAATVRDPAEGRGQGRTMGTTWSVKTHGFSGDSAGLFRRVQASLDGVEAEFSLWRADSALSQFNAAAGTDAVSVSPDFLGLAQTAGELTRFTAGAYDPTALSLVHLWGFGPAPRRTTAPTNAEIAAALLRPRMEALVIGTSTLSKRDPAVQLDLTSVTEGLGLKKAAAVLEAGGCGDFLLEVGGELTARGAWTVAIEHPWRTVRLENATLSTSGTHRQNHGEGVSHLIDARTGRPVAHSTVSVSVMHDDPVLADGWATALAVLGAEAGLPIAAAHGLAAQFVVEKGGSLDLISTPRWPAAYLASVGDPTAR